jgi:hypothetical protein
MRTPPKKKMVHFIEPDTPPTQPKVEWKVIYPQCPFCKRKPCFMDNDDNYERLVLLGTDMEARGLGASQIRAALQLEMSYHYYGGDTKKWCDEPYCIEREIIDAYPPTSNNKKGQPK